MGLIPILLIVAIVLLLVRSKGQRFPVPTGTGIASRDPVSLILLGVVVLLFKELRPLVKTRAWLGSPTTARRMSVRCTKQFPRINAFAARTPDADRFILGKFCNVADRPVN